MYYKFRVRAEQGVDKLPQMERRLFAVMLATAMEQEQLIAPSSPPSPSLTLVTPVDTTKPYWWTTVEGFIHFCKSINFTNKRMIRFNIERFGLQDYKERIFNEIPKESWYKGERIIKHNIIKSQLESPKIYLADTKSREQAKWLINQVFYDCDDSNRIAVSCKQHGIYYQYMLTKTEILAKLDNILSLENLYFSVNTFWKISRKKKDARRLNACFVDLDYYKVPELKGLKPKEVIKLLREKGLFNDLEPSFFISSGQGLYIYYLLHHSNAKATNKLYKRIQDELHERFKPYGADPKARDISHVLRPPGSYRTGRVRAEIIFNSNEIWGFKAMEEPQRRYQLDDVAKVLLPPLPMTKTDWKEFKKERKKQAKKRLAEKQKKLKNNVIPLRTLRNLYFNRLRDLETLQELRGDDAVENCREFMCFLYRLWTLHVGGDKDKALQDTLDFNNDFPVPLEEEEVINATVSAELAYENYLEAHEEYYGNETQDVSFAAFAYQRQCYLYSNKTLIQELEITEQEQMDLSVIISKKFRDQRYYLLHKEEKKKKEKERYREQNPVSKREQTFAEAQKIRDLLEQGLKRKEICVQLGLTPKQYVQRCTLLKREGLLQ